MNRRTFIKAASLAGTAVLVDPLSAFGEGKPPNIMMIAVDDLNYDAITWLGGRMPGLTGKKYIYTYNHFADGKNQFYDGKYPGGESLKAMERAAESDPAIRERIRFMYYRTKEELYDLERDPDALDNLIAAPSAQSDLAALRAGMRATLAGNGDPFEKAYDQYLKSVTAN